MNDRIKQLAEQAASEFTQSFNWEYLLQLDKDILEKFAELIIRECSDVVNYYHSRNEPITSRQILQHFGVEE